jgi:hypothetical protein
LRGGGKTTASRMIMLAITGKPPSATAWSDSPEERRKAIFAALRENVPSIIFDNIPRGSVLSCPTVEKVCTSAELTDRVLKESRNEEVTRPDPENRPFEHPDPTCWTLDHRGKILASLYTLLIGNKRRKDKAATRFKDWQRLVASAIEYAAYLFGKAVSFKDLFMKVEAEDEAAATTADVLEALDFKWGKKLYAPVQNAITEFTSADVSTWIEANLYTVDEARILKNFIAPKCDSGKIPTRTVTARLKTIVGGPTRVGKKILTLKKRTDHAETTSFWIEEKRASE